jgi:pullulanase/glycogen debranching enzyme
VGGMHEGTDGQAAEAGLRHDASKVLLDPYATSVVSRARWGEQGNPHLDYESDGVLGLAATWPQMATPVPDPRAHPFDWQVCLIAACSFPSGHLPNVDR